MMAANVKNINSVFAFEEYLDNNFGKFNSETYKYKYIYRFNENYETEGNVPNDCSNSFDFYINGFRNSTNSVDFSFEGNPIENFYIAAADSPLRIPLTNSFCMKSFDDFKDVETYKNWDFSRLDCRELNIFMMAFALKDDWNYMMDFSLFDFLNGCSNIKITAKSIQAHCFIRDYSYFSVIKHYKYENLCERCKLDFENAEPGVVRYNKYEISFNFTTKKNLYSILFNFRYQLFCNRCGKCLFLINLYDEKNNTNILC